MHSLLNWNLTKSLPEISLQNTKCTTVVYTYLWLWSNRHTSCLIFPIVHTLKLKTLLLPKLSSLKWRGEISESIKIGLVKLPNFWLTIFTTSKKIGQLRGQEIGWNKKQLIIKCQKGARKMSSYNSHYPESVPNNRTPHCWKQVCSISLVLRCS